MTPGHMTVVILVTMMITAEEPVVVVDVTMTIVVGTMIIPEIMTEATGTVIAVVTVEIGMMTDDTSAPAVVK